MADKWDFGGNGPMIQAQSWITFGPSNSAMGSGLFDVLLRPISKVRTYKQVSKQTIFLLNLFLREREL